MAEGSKGLTAKVGTVQVTVSENVTLETLHSAIIIVGGLTGCRTCGLIGIDLLFRGDPEPFNSVRGLPGVTSVGLQG